MRLPPPALLLAPLLVPVTEAMFRGCSSYLRMV
jgi:hypothetical protein